MKEIKVFISQPMQGLSLAEVQEKRTEVLERVGKCLEEKGLTDFSLDPINAIIRGVSIEDECYMDVLGLDPENPPRTWWLGQAIQEMAAADLFVFGPGWGSAKGCLVEQKVYDLYFKDVPRVGVTCRRILNEEELDKLVAKLKES
jgi:hypothetical protein